MKLIKMTCPNCCAKLEVDADKGQATCEFCGSSLLIEEEVQHIKYDDMEEAGYKFEQGRQKALKESEMSKNNTTNTNITPNKTPINKPACNPNYKPDYSTYSPSDFNAMYYATRKKKQDNTGCWILGWIFIFPVPLTIILIKSKELHKALRVGLIIISWIVYLFLAGVFCVGVSRYEKTHPTVEATDDSFNNYGLSDDFNDGLD